MMMHCHIATEVELVAPKREPNVDDTVYGYKIRLNLEIFTTRWVPTLKRAWPIERHSGID